MFAVRPHREAIRHGGGLRAAALAYPEAPQPWLDMSTGINPVPYQGQAATEQSRNRLPDPLELAALEKVAAQYFGTTADRVAAAAGAETIIRLLPVLLGRLTVDIVGPTYGAHAESWQASHLAPHIIPASQAQSSAADALVIVNPNNPDGHIFSAEALRAILHEREKLGRWLIIDESFAECAPEISMAATSSRQLIVLRSFGKFFGLAGLRLGFAVASPEFKSSLRNLTGDWPVSADAITFGTQAYGDKPWSKRTLSDLHMQAQQLDELLVKAGFEIAGGTCLFRLARHERANDWFHHLCHRGILVRPFDHTNNVLRFGLPPSADINRLSAALESGL